MPAGSSGRSSRAWTRSRTPSDALELARALVELAPARDALAQRIEAMVGAPPSKAKPKEGSSPRPLRAEEVARTQASWGEDRNRRGGGGLLLLLSVVVAGVLGFAIYTGRLDVAGMRGPAKTAASAVGSVVAGATAAVESCDPVVPADAQLRAATDAGAFRERGLGRRGRRLRGLRLGLAVRRGERRDVAAALWAARAHAPAGEAEALREPDGSPEALKSAAPLGRVRGRRCRCRR